MKDSKGKRPYKYTPFIQLLEDDKVYSAACIVKVAMDSGLIHPENKKLKIRVRTSLNSLKLRRNFPVNGDGLVCLDGQRAIDGYFGKRWKGAVTPYQNFVSKWFVFLNLDLLMKILENLPDGFYSPMCLAKRFIVTDRLTEKRFKEAFQSVEYLAIRYLVKNFPWKYRRVQYGDCHFDQPAFLLYHWKAAFSLHERIQNEGGNVLAALRVQMDSTIRNP